MGASVLHKAKACLIFGISAAVFLITALISCDNKPATGPVSRSPVLPLGEAWVWVESGVEYGYIFKSEGVLERVIKTGSVWGTPAARGVWVISGNDLTITLTGGESRTYPYSVSATTLKWGAVTYTRTTITQSGGNNLINCEIAGVCTPGVTAAWCNSAGGTVVASCGSNNLINCQIAGACVPGVYTAALCTLAGGTVVTSCGGNIPGGGLILEDGWAWTYDTMGVSFGYVFKSNGAFEIVTNETGSWISIPIGTWSNATGSSVTITTTGSEAVSVPYTVSGSTLLMTGDVFTKTQIALGGNTGSDSRLVNAVNEAWLQDAVTGYIFKQNGEVDVVSRIGNAWVITAGMAAWSTNANQTQLTLIPNGGEPLTGSYTISGNRLTWRNITFTRTNLASVN